MLRRALIVALCGVFLTSVLCADEPPSPPTGEVRLASGRVAHYTIHFDRNSLQDSVRHGDRLIAVTSSGALESFELPTVRLVRERIDTEGVTCLGKGEGATILAGLSDGRVCRVDPATLKLTELTKLSGSPRWIGWGPAAENRPAGLVVVTRRTKPVDRVGRHWDMPYSVVNDLATGKTFALEDAATTFLLDRTGRVWLGADKGEWGGRLTRVDLPKGTITAMKPPPSPKPGPEAFWHGVYGFVELRDGQVWVFGGTSHMGFNSGYITRIDEAEPRPLYEFETPGELEKAPNSDRPRLPITHIVEENGGLLVYSYSDVFRVGKELKSWKKLTALEIHYRWGRPDAVGSYPSVRAVHPPIRAGDPYILATVGDGYVLLEGPKAISHSLPGQLGASGIYHVKSTSEGTLYFEGDDRLPAWTLDAQGWKIASLAPPFEIDPANDAADFEKDAGAWYETTVLVGPGGAIYTVSGTGVSDGTRTTGRRVGGKSVRLGRETSSLDPSSSFITADGTLWNASFGELKKFAKGKWETVAQVPQAKSVSELTPLTTNGPPWLLLDGDTDDLWHLGYGARGDKPQLTQVQITEAGRALRVDDAIPWPNDSLLLATDGGLRAYHPSMRKLSRVDFPEPPQPATTIARDGLGRLWMGGATNWRSRMSSRGLWMGDPGAKTVEAFDLVPSVGRNEVHAVAPDPQHADGVIVALGSGGVAFIRALPAGARP